MDDVQSWDAAEVTEIYEEDPTDYTTFIRVNGSVRPLDIGANFVSAVKEVARESKFGKFSLYLNGTELEPDSANIPDTIEEGMKLEMKPYDWAGNKSI